MGFPLDAIVPWGRSCEEYVAMFDPSEADLRRRLLGCGDGPAGFNAGLTAQGGRVVSCDPLYRFDAAQIRHRIAATSDTVMEQVLAHRSDYIWDTIPSVAPLGRIRMAAMNAFLDDFEAGSLEGRYVAGGLPDLPFGDAAFDLALCSHFLFLYSDRLSAAFHLQAIVEMLRVAPEARIFPLLTLAGRPSPHLGTVTEQLAAQGFRTCRRTVPYEFQRGGHDMLVVMRLPSDPAGGAPGFSTIS
ncbi:MAG: SAM-dependent methyltransferase [Deltaproteobacteria bacterium]|nr:SAM-dependent methyltransferase [Deltaproteobacteria bacterium]